MLPVQEEEELSTPMKLLERNKLVKKQPANQKDLEEVLVIPERQKVKIF